MVPPLTSLEAYISNRDFSGAAALQGSRGCLAGLLLLSQWRLCKGMAIACASTILLQLSVWNGLSRHVLVTQAHEIYSRLAGTSQYSFELQIAACLYHMHKYAQAEKEALKVRQTSLPCLAACLSAHCPSHPRYRLASYSNMGQSMNKCA